MSGMSSFNLNSALSKAREAADMAREVASSAAATAATKAAEISKVAKARGSDLIDRLNYRPESVIISGQPITLVKVLAEGGYGYVYIAKHQDDGRTYAVKRMLTQTSEAADMAKTEIDIMNQLPKHQNIVRLLASEKKPMGNGRGSEFLLVMEFCGNGTLGRHVTPDSAGCMPPQLDEERLLQNMLDVCKGIALLHAQQPPIVHRDLKLENVLESERGVCKLCDFGSASTRTFDPKTATRKEKLEEEDIISRFSTAMNRAPEMVDLHGARGAIGPAADVWALGCMIFTLAYQRHPFGDSALGIMNGRYYFPPTSPYSERIGTLIEGLLLPDPAARPSVAPRGSTDPSPAVITRITQAIADLTTADLAKVEAAPFRGSHDGMPAVAKPAPPPPPPPDLMGGGDLIGVNGTAGNGAGSGFDAAFGANGGFDDFADFGSAVNAAPVTPPAAPMADLLDMGGLSIAPASSSADLFDFFASDATPVSPTPPAASAMRTASAASLADDFDSMFGGAPLQAQPTCSPPAASTGPDLDLLGGVLAPPVPTPPQPMAAGSDFDLLGGFDGGGGGNAPPACAFAAASSLPFAAALPPSSVGSPAATMQGSLRPGHSLTVHGLQAKPEFNGQSGRMLSFDPTKERYSVELADGQKVSLKRANLTPVLDGFGQPVFA